MTDIIQQIEKQKKRIEAITQGRGQLAGEITQLQRQYDEETEKLKEKGCESIEAANKEIEQLRESVVQDKEIMETVLTEAEEILKG
jgi:lipoate-protein ligase A